MADPSIDRIVHYTLSSQDVIRINDRRRRVGTIDRNNVTAGQVFPAIVVAVSADFADATTRHINAQVFLDGDDTHWVTSAKEGSAPGEWFWPPRVA